MADEHTTEPGTDEAPEKKHGSKWLALILTFLILLILFLLLAPFLMTWLSIRNQKPQRARGDVNAIATAVNGFYADWSRLPGTNHFLEGNAALMDELTASSKAVINTRRTVYLETETAMAYDGMAPEFLDPWGEPYRVYLDIGVAPDEMPYDGKIGLDLGRGPATFLTMCIAISSGKNGNFGDKDDIYSVKQF